MIRSYESDGKMFQTGPEMEERHHIPADMSDIKDKLDLCWTICTEIFNKTQSRCFPDRGINNHLHTLKSKKDLGGSSIPSLINNLSIKVLRIEVMLSSRVTREECNSRASLNFQDHNITSNSEITRFRATALRDPTSPWPQSGHVAWRSQKEQRNKKKANDGCCHSGKDLWNVFVGPPNCI